MPIGRVRARRAVFRRPWPAVQARGTDPDRGLAGDGLSARLARGSSAATIIYVAAGGLTYVGQFAVARTIGAGGYGVYAYVFAWVTVLAYVSALGFDISLLRFIPAYLATRNFSLLRGVTQYAVRRVATFGCGIGIAGSAVVVFHSGSARPELVDTFVVGFAVVPVLALLWIHTAIVRGLGGVASALLPDRLVRDGVLLVLVACGGAFWKIGAVWSMTATLLGSAAGLGLVRLAMHRRLPDAIKMAAASFQSQTWRRTILPLVVVGSAEALLNRTGVMLLGWLTDTKQAGIYAMTFNIALAAMLPRTAINTLLAPVMSRLFVEKRQAELRAIIATAAWWTLLGAAAIALPVLLFAVPLLAIFGRDFVAGAPALRILVAGQAIAAAAGSQLHLMNMTGHERSAARLLVASAAANTALAAMLVVPLGPTGAALTATTALIGWNAGMALSIWRHLQILPGVLAAWPERARRLARLGEAAE